MDFRDDVLKYAAETVIDYPLLIGEEAGLEAVKAVGMQPAFPFTVFADSKQRIVALKVGELHQDEADLILDRVARYRCRSPGTVRCARPDFRRPEGTGDAPGRS